MIIFSNMEIKNFRNLKHVMLKDLKDLNILIGPNNCGKTNILQLINYFSKLSCGIACRYLCSQCSQFQQEKKMDGMMVLLSYDDFYLRKKPNELKIEVRISFDKNSIEKFIPGVLTKQESLIKEAGCEKIKDEIILENDGPFLSAIHLSPFIHCDILNEIKKWILYCPEKRLERYKSKSFTEYIREKKFSGAKFRQLIKFIKEIVDPNIHDHQYEKLIRKVNEEELIVPIAEQGSGVRSLICLVADILAAEDSKILLIDEPELGLNPFAKQEFIKLLLEITGEKQVFLATQDPTFVNPILWKDYSDKVSIYLFSLINEEFMKIDLYQNKENPNVFAGYLPHTVSLKNIHIYVEGTSDVYIFQILLRKFLKSSYPKKWFKIENKIGIFHLCGDFWPHLLYTVPKPPYKCIVILDGDKRENAQKIINKHNESLTNTSKFKFANSIQDVKNILLQGDTHPVYCLQKDKIEDYLFPNSPPPNYKKTIDGPKAAERLDKLPPEIEELFRVIIGDKNG